MNTPATFSVVVVGLVVALGVFLTYQNRRLLFDTCPPSTSTRFIPNPHNDKALIAYGLKDDQLKKILDDFAVQYEMPGGIKYLIRNEDQRLRVVFPEDIEPRLFSFLINYVQYPKDLDLQDRSIVSTGTATLSLDFGLPSPTLSRQKALFYIPTDDNEYDLVFVRVGEQTYENSFAGKCWQPMQNPRMPAQVATPKQ